MIMDWDQKILHDILEEIENRKGKEEIFMGYSFREVKCPFCDHIFMWNKDGREGLILHEYKFKETGKLVEKAICPKCSNDMLVLEHVLEGIDTMDDRIERIGIRGI